MIRHGTSGHPKDHRTFRNIDAFLADVEPDESMPRRGRPPTAAERYAAENPQATYTEQRAVVELERALGKVLPNLGLGSLSSRDHGDDTVTMDPASFRMGPPAGRRVRNDAQGGRPLRGAVDAWLRSGGWGMGKEGAGSLALAGPDSEEARARIVSQWRWEMQCRGWEGGDKRWVFRRWHTESDGSVRMYWWTTDKAPATPPPPHA